jgi:DUF305 family protein family protein
MLWHQEQAQELASLVQGRTSRPELQRLAISIHTTQNIDVAQMTAWFRARDPAAGDYLVHSDTQPADRWFAGMMARSQLRTLAATSGQRFDFLFVDMLVEHHKGAIVMSDEVLADGRALPRGTGFTNRPVDASVQLVVHPARLSSGSRCARGRRGVGSGCSCTDPTGADRRASLRPQSRSGH